MASRLAIAVSAIGFGQSAFVSLVPLMIERLHLDAFAIGAATAAGAAAFLVGAPLWGAAGERLGQSRLLRLLAVVMLAAQVIFAGLLFEAPQAPALAIGVLVLSRVIYGLAASGVMPTAQVWVSRSVAEEQRRGALGLISAGVSSGRLAGSLPAALAFISPLLPLALFVVSPIMLWLAPRGRAPEAKTDRAPAARLMPFDRRILPMLAMGLCLTLGFGQVQIALGPMIGRKFGLDATPATSATGVALMLVAVVMIAVQVLVAARLRLSERGSVLTGCILTATGMAALALAESYPTAIAALVCAAFGIAVATPGYTAWLMRKVAPAQQGAAAGWLASTHVVGQSAGALAGGYGFTIWPYAPLLACAALAVVATLIAAATRTTP